MLGDGVSSIEERPNVNKVVVKLNSSRSVVGDAGKKKNLKFYFFQNFIFTIVLICIGRVGNGDLLNLEAAGIELGEDNRVKVNQLFQTNVEHIYAVGDLVKN